MTSLAEMARAAPIASKVIDGQLIISIGVDALMDLVCASADWEPDQIRVANPEAYAAAIGRELLRGETWETFLKPSIEEAALVATDHSDCGVEDVV